MSDEQTEHNRDILNIPLAISAQTVNYNIPGRNGVTVKLDGQILAGIYAGRIREWDDQRIAAINPRIPLPHAVIIPIRRADASGDTFIFTQFLDFSMPSSEDQIGYGTSVAWPQVAGEHTANGNGEMVEVLAATPYAIGYVGISFRNAIAAAKLGTVRLKNQSGKFVLPTAITVNAGASELDPRTPPDERLSLVFAPGDNSYPTCLPTTNTRLSPNVRAIQKRRTSFASFYFGPCHLTVATLPNISMPLASFHYQTSFALLARTKSTRSSEMTPKQNSRSRAFGARDIPLVA
jgi:phosphate ABC transporter phosphate-binding protein